MHFHCALGVDSNYGSTAGGRKAADQVVHAILGPKMSLLQLKDPFVSVCKGCLFLCLLCFESLLVQCTAWWLCYMLALLLGVGLVIVIVIVLNCSCHCYCYCSCNWSYGCGCYCSCHCYCHFCCLKLCTVLTIVSLVRGASGGAHFSFISRVCKGAAKAQGAGLLNSCDIAVDFA